MKRITLIVTATILAILLFSVSSFATNNIASNAAQGVRNVVGGAENVVENAASGITNGIRNGVSNAENTMNKSMTSTTNNNTNYNATRTATTRMATTGTNNTFFGMNAITWSWLILAIVGIITVALVWYYGKQFESNYNHNDDNY